MANTFYYGASKCMIAKYDETTHEYGEAWEEEFIKQLGIDGGSSSSNKYYGSNKVIFQTNGASGKSLTLQMSAFSQKYKTDILGQTKVGGIVIEGPDDVPASFALGVQLEGNGGGMRVWFLMCKSEVPTYTAATNTDTPTEDTMSASIEATPCTYNLDGTDYKATAIYSEKGDADYDTFLDAVPTETVTVSSGTGTGTNGTGTGTNG